MRKILEKLIKQIKIVLLLGLLSIGFILLTNHKISLSKAATEQTITDQNGDGVIDLIDARILTPPQTVNCPVCVDVNGDKVINQADIDLISYQLERSGVEDLSVNSYQTSFDVNNDGTIS